MSHKMYFYFLWIGNIGLAGRGRITMPGYFTAVVNICDAFRDFQESCIWNCEIKWEVTTWVLFCWFCRPLWFDHMQCSKKRQNEELSAIAIFVSVYVTIKHQIGTKWSKNQFSVCHLLFSIDLFKTILPKSFLFTNFPVIKWFFSAHLIFWVSIVHFCAQFSS